MSTDRFEYLSGVLSRLARDTTPSELRAESFFVARHSVLTLAYSGWTEAIAELKARLIVVLPDLPEESPGSMWPKTTVAAVRDDGGMETEDIVSLRQSVAAGSTCIARSGFRLGAASIELVEVKTRSMESTIRRARFPLLGSGTEDRVAPVERAHVNAVLGQWRQEALSAYVPWLTQEGHRESHYREDHHELILSRPVAGSIPCIDLLRDRVESVLPGRYAWIEPNALHVTVRSLGAP